MILKFFVLVQFELKKEFYTNSDTIERISKSELFYLYHCLNINGYFCAYNSLLDIIRNFGFTVVDFSRRPRVVATTCKNKFK